jgi:hypothetical protein
MASQVGVQPTARSGTTPCPIGCSPGCWRTALTADNSQVPHRVEPSDRRADEVRGTPRPSPSLAPNSGHAPLLDLQRAAGNQATTRLLLAQATSPSASWPARVQRAPDKNPPDPVKTPPVTGGKTAGSTGPTAVADTGPDLALPWTDGQSVLFEVSASDVRFIVGVAAKEEKVVRAFIGKVAPRMAADNARIADPALRVRVCFITPTSTRFALWGGRPALMIDPKNADSETVAHEMGHAVLDALGHQAAAGGGAGAAAADLRIRIADVFARLSATKPATKDIAFGVGVMMVDPPSWAPKLAPEHPYQDADEFFASAKAAYQIDAKALQASIARATKIDPAVAAPAKDLMALLDAMFGKGSTAPAGKLPTERQAAAEKELGRFKSTGDVETSTVTSWLLNLLINPGARPRKAK